MPESSGRTGKEVAFGDVVQLSRRRTKSPGLDGIERYVGLEHMEPGYLRIRHWGDVADGTTFTNVFRSGEVLFGKRRAYQRKVAVSDFSGVCSGDIYVLTPKCNSLLPELLPFICQSEPFYDYVISMSQGGLSPRVNWKALAEYQFKLPDPEEQHRIAKALWAAESILESYLSLGTRLRDARYSHLEQFFGRKSAECVPLPEVATIAAGGTPSKSKAEYWGGDLPWASGKDLKVRELSSTSLNLTPEGWAVAKKAPVGATLVVVRGMILAHTFPVTVCTVPMAFNQDLRALVPKEGLLPEYLTLWAEWAGPWFLARTSESSHGTKRLDGEVFEDALVPRVGLKKQMALIQAQQAFLEQQGRLEKRKVQILACKAAMLREFLTGSP